MNPTAPAPQAFAGLPLTAWVAIGIAFLAIIALYHFWSIATAIGRKRAEAAADKRAQTAAEIRINRALRHPDPVEPAPLDYVRAGLPVPPPRSTALLGQKLDQLEQRIGNGTAGGGAATAVPTISSSAPSTTATPAGSGTASGPSVPSQPIDQIINTAAAKAGITLPPPPGAK